MMRLAVPVPEPGVIVREKERGEHLHIAWEHIYMDKEGALFIPVVIKEAFVQIAEVIRKEVDSEQEVEMVIANKLVGGGQFLSPTRAILSRHQPDRSL